MWIRHPARGDLLVWVGPYGARCYKWSTLEDIAGAEEDGSDDASGSDGSNNSEDPNDLDDSNSSEGSSTSDTSDDSLEAKAPVDDCDETRRVTWASITSDNTVILYATVPNDGTYTTSYLPHTDLRLHSVAIPTPQSTLQPTRRAPEVAARVKYFLGTHKNNVVFLDHDSWLCTWNPRDTAERIARHLFVPRDWVNTGVAFMAAVNENGTVFWPRFGEVAVVRNGIRV